MASEGVFKTKNFGTFFPSIGERLFVFPLKKEFHMAEHTNDDALNQATLAISIERLARFKFFIEAHNQSHYLQPDPVSNYLEKKLPGITAVGNSSPINIETYSGIVDGFNNLVMDLFGIPPASGVVEDGGFSRDHYDDILYFDGEPEELTYEICLDSIKALYTETRNIKWEEV